MCIDMGEVGLSVQHHAGGDGSRMCRIGDESIERSMVEFGLRVGLTETNEGEAWVNLNNLLGEVGATTSPCSSCL